MQTQPINLACHTSLKTRPTDTAKNPLLRLTTQTANHVYSPTDSLFNTRGLHLSSGLARNTVKSESRSDCELQDPAPYVQISVQKNVGQGL